MRNTTSRLVRPLPRISTERFERLSARVSLVALSAESGIPFAYLSEFERGLRSLKPEQERARREALETLAIR
jgi:hypothetical protein